LFCSQLTIKAQKAHKTCIFDLESMLQWYNEPHMLSLSAVDDTKLQQMKDFDDLLVFRKHKKSIIPGSLKKVLELLQYIPSNYLI